MSKSNIVNKQILWRYINKKINRSIHHLHVLSVINILFEEMINDLKDGKEVKIYNFGTFSLKEDPIKKYYNIFFKKVMESRLHKTMRFKLANSIHKKLLLLLDPDKISNAKEGPDE